MTAGAAESFAKLEHQRLENLYEISQLFASFETIERSFDPALAIAARTLPLRSAILIETEDDRSRKIVWSSEGQSVEHMRGASEHLEVAYAYLIGAASTEALDISEQVGITPLPRRADPRANVANRFIVIPLVVAHRPPFGALQLEGDRLLDKSDLMFVNALANQLAIALDRDRARRRDITRREHAEEGRAEAEARGDTAERGRSIAERSSDKYKALASENARLHEHAQQAVRAREQILAVVSHDLRSPLGTILLVTDMLAQAEETEDLRGELPRAIGKIKRAAGRMLRLIEDLLDFSSIEAGQLSIRRQPHDSGSIIQETVVAIESVAQAKELRVTAEIDPDLPKAYCDRDRILQVLSNLVGNAIKVAAKGGRITLRVSSETGTEGAPGHELLFAVSDDGPGISEEDVKSLFERYWRSGEATYKGTGLGLPIARGIVSAHGGRIWVESELGRGATFLFTVPAADVTLLFAAPTADAASSGTGL